MDLRSSGRLETSPYSTVDLSAFFSGDRNSSGRGEHGSADHHLFSGSRELGVHQGTVGARVLDRGCHRVRMVGSLCGCPRQAVYSGVARTTPPDHLAAGCALDLRIARSGSPVLQQTPIHPPIRRGWVQGISLSGGGHRDRDRAGAGTDLLEAAQGMGMAALAGETGVMLGRLSARARRIPGPRDVTSGVGYPWLS